MSNRTLFETQHAQRGGHLAITLEAALGRVFTGYKVRVTRPDASTNGGELALQHIQLVRNDGLTFMVGCTNAAEGTASLRTLGHTLDLTKRRFGRELVLPPLEYMRFLEIATTVLTTFDLKVTVVSHHASAPPRSPEASPKRTSMLPYVLGVGVFASVFALATGLVAAMVW
jgi:hypothetical protein